MKKSLLIFLLPLVIFVSCGGPKQTISYQDLAKTSFSEGNYQQALNEFQSYLNEQELKGEEPDSRVYSAMAEAHFNLGNMNEAERYYDWAMTKNAVSQNLISKMTEHYKEIDNLSKEITALEYYQNHFANGRDSLLMKNRLFETYVISENWNKADQLWNDLDENTQSKESYMQMYFDVNKQLEREKECDQLALQLLELNSRNREALEWMAKKYYNLGENRYQSAMSAYNKKKTNKNYNILLKELDQVTADLKKSLKYFEILWEMEDGEQYAIYMANIYARFDDKAKSQYYKSLIK